MQASAQQKPRLTPVAAGAAMQASARQMAPVLRPWAGMLGLISVCSMMRSLLVGEGRAELPALLIWCIGYGPLALVSSYQSLHHWMEPALLGCMLGRIASLVLFLQLGTHGFLGCAETCS